MSLRRPVLYSLVGLAGLCAIDTLHGQSIKIVPDRVLFDESAVIRVDGLNPKERVSVQADLVDGAGKTWRAQADFVADANGLIDISKQAPAAGSYKEVSGMGLIWSMRPAEKDVTIYRPPAGWRPQTIQFSLFRNGTRAAGARLEQLKIGDGVKQTKLTGQLHGIFFTPNTNERHPAVLVVGGSDGGVPTLKAAWLASRGFPALALAYFRYENLPPLLEAIPLEYFGQALIWMMQQPEVQPDHIAVLGSSRGGELALQLGSMYPQIHTVIAYVPANVRYSSCCGQTHVPYAWTWTGQPLPYLPPRIAPNPALRLQATIKVEQTQGPILLISGQDDGVWESTEMADEVVFRLKQSKFPYKFEHLKYNHAGHWAGEPDIIPAWHASVTNPNGGREVNPGGTIAGNALSSIDAAPKVLEFLREGLSLRQVQTKR